MVGEESRKRQIADGNSVIGLFLFLQSSYLGGRPYIKEI